METQRTAPWTVGAHTPISAQVLRETAYQMDLDMVKVPLAQLIRDQPVTTAPCREQSNDLETRVYAHELYFYQLQITLNSPMFQLCHRMPLG